MTAKPKKHEGYVIAVSKTAPAYFSSSSSYDRPRWVGLTEATTYLTADMASAAAKKLWQSGSISAKVVPLAELNGLEMEMPDRADDQMDDVSDDQMVADKQAADDGDEMRGVCPECNCEPCECDGEQQDDLDIDIADDETFQDEEDSLLAQHLRAESGTEGEETARLRPEELSMLGKKRADMKESAPSRKGMTEGLYDYFKKSNPLPTKPESIKIGNFIVEIEPKGSYIGFVWHDSQGREHYGEVRTLRDHFSIKTRRGLINYIRDEIEDQEARLRKQGMAEGSEERGQNRLWQMITDYEQRAKATKNDIKKAHYLKMASDLRGKLKTSDEQGVTEGEDAIAGKYDYGRKVSNANVNEATGFKLPQRPGNDPAKPTENKTTAANMTDPKSKQFDFKDPVGKEDKPETDLTYAVANQHEDKVNVPAEIIAQLKSVIDDFKKTAKANDGMDDAVGSFALTAGAALQQLLDDLELGTTFGIKQAQIHMTSYMSPIVNHIPADVINFISRGGRKSSLKDLFGAKWDKQREIK